MATNFHLNYYNLKISLTESNKVFREIFKSRWKILFSKKWNDTKKDAAFFTDLEIGIKIKNQFKGLQFQICLETGNTKEWDINILATILLSKLFQENHTKTHIERIRDIRNKVSHFPDMNVSDEMFDELYESLRESMKSLGCEDCFLESIKKKFINQNERVKIDFNENLEYKNLMDSAEREFLNNNYVEAVKSYTNAINFYEHSNDEFGDLYFQRSSSNMRIYDEVKDNKYLYKSLLDAEKVIDYQPHLTKGYVQAADLALKLNELEKSEKYYQNALAIEFDNESYKNSLAFVRSKIGQQERLEYLDLRYLPLTTEENTNAVVKKLEEEQGLQFGDKEIDELKKLAEKIDPTKADVFLGHEYRDGSRKIKQSYEMAAKCYGKAANKNNAEALYNLALLHMRGLGVKMDFQMGISLLKQAAKQPAFVLNKFKIPNVGVKEAEHSLGLAYHQGTYVDKNIGTAVYWYEKAIIHENNDSANNLGLLYQEGNGVVQSFDKAEELFLLSHKLGNNGSISNLVGLYLCRNEPDQALMWHNRDLENNSIIAKTNHDEILEKIRNLKKMNEYLSDRTIVSEEKSNLVKDMINLNLLRQKKKLSPCEISQNFLEKYDHKMLKDYAFNRGSIIAEKMLKAQSLFFEGMHMLKTGAYKEQTEKFITLISEAFQIESLVCLIPVHLNEKVIEILKFFIKPNKINELDCHARIGYMFLTENIDFIGATIQKYPNRQIMYQLRGALYCFEQKWTEALKDFDFAVKLDPKCYECLYFKSSALFQLQRSTECIESFKKFIQIVPKDYRKLPHAYYSMALSIMSKNLDKAKEFYEEGLKCEKNQLPCFLPYKSTFKDNLSLLFDNRINKPTSVSKSEVSDSSGHIRELIAKDYRRTSLITEHRFYYAAFNIKRRDLHLVFHTKPPLKKQVLESIIGLKPIFFRDIDFTKDHVLKKSVLTLKSIDIPTVDISTKMVVVDDNNVAERVAIYNLKEDPVRIKEMFEIGCRFSIINPYVRMAADGSILINIYS